MRAVVVPADLLGDWRAALTAAGLDPSAPHCLADRETAGRLLARFEQADVERLLGEAGELSAPDGRRPGTVAEAGVPDYRALTVPVHQESDIASYNDQVIAEFRANHGVVKQFGPNLLLLTTTGRTSGQPRTSPTAYLADDGAYLIAASAAGADHHPMWFLNLQATPEATIEVGDRTIPVRAEVPTTDERDRLWAKLTERMPGFAEYQTKTSRVIPVVVLRPAGGADAAS